MGLNKTVEFSTAKLLKEKGFDEPCSQAYKEVESPVLYVHQDKKYNNSFKKEWQNTVRKNSQMDNAVINRYSAPSIAEVCMWLYQKHEIWISVLCDSGSDLLFTFKIYSTKIGEEKCLVNGNIYNLPTESYEAAIEYVLLNLI